MNATQSERERDANEWWTLRCLEEAVRDIDRLTGAMSTDWDAIHTAYRRKHDALARLDELRKDDPSP